MALAKAAGIVVTLQQALSAAGALYALAVVTGLLVAGRCWTRGDIGGAPYSGKGRAFAARPLMAWLSSVALAKAWR